MKTVQSTAQSVSQTANRFRYMSGRDLVTIKNTASGAAVGLPRPVAPPRDRGDGRGRSPRGGAGAGTRSAQGGDEAIGSRSPHGRESPEAEACGNLYAVGPARFDAKPHKRCTSPTLLTDETPCRIHRRRAVPIWSFSSHCFLLGATERVAVRGGCGGAVKER